MLCGVGTSTSTIDALDRSQKSLLRHCLEKQLPQGTSTDHPRIHIIIGGHVGDKRLLVEINRSVKHEYKLVIVRGSGGLADDLASIFVLLRDVTINDSSATFEVIDENAQIAGMNPDNTISTGDNRFNIAFQNYINEILFVREMKDDEDAD